MTGLPSPVEPPAGNVGRLHSPSVATAAQVRVDSPSAGLQWARRYRDRLRVTDAAIVVIAMLAAVATRSSVVGQSVAHESPLARMGVPAVIAAAWLLSLAVFRTRETHILGAGSLEYRRVLNATATTFGIAAITFLLVQAPDARWYLVVGAPVGISGLLAGRWMLRRWLLAQRRDGRFLSRAIVVGSRIDAEYVAAQITGDAAAGFVVVGAAIDGDDRSALLVGQTSVPVVSDIGGAAAAAAASGASSVIVTGQYNSGGDTIRQLSWDLEGTATELVLSSRLTDVAGPRIHFRPVDGLPMLHVEIPTFEGWRHVLKRGFDIVFAGTALLLLSPLFAAVALLVKFDSPGPVIFKQTRCGRDGSTFDMFKFRSMVQTAEQDLAALVDENDGSGVLFKLRSDPRVTRVGRVLRKYSIDELPQFWNILIGDMSVVGPRPPLVSEAESYETAVKRRLMIKPGLTGLWQVGGRSDLSWDESVRLDLYYVENWSLAGDLKIVWRTVNTVVRPTGAY